MRRFLSSISKSVSSSPLLCSSLYARPSSSVIGRPASSILSALGHLSISSSSISVNQLLLRNFSSSSESPASSSSQPIPKFKGGECPIDIKNVDLSIFPPERIRNFCIVAHIDHGKSTLADRLLELTGTLSSRVKNEQYLDKLQVERERGITVKACTASLFYRDPRDGQLYLLNLIDTPGHVDFSYEVSRSLAACQGALLLVDASQGIQAQTLANYFLAMQADLTIIPLITKIDQSTSQPERVANQMKTALGVEPSEIIPISSKSGLNVDKILPAILDIIPPPVGDTTKPFKALLFDSWYDEYRGVICLIEVSDGCVKKGDSIVAAHSGTKYEVLDVGIMYPEPLPTGALYPGQVGYLIAGMKSTKESRVGDTFYHFRTPVDPFPGFKPAKPMVFAGVYPSDASEFDHLRDSIEKLLLTDASVTVQKESSAALGMGFRCGFLGLLHMDVFQERLEQEYNANIIITSPTVPYRIEYNDGRDTLIENPTSFPDPPEVKRYLEPMVSATVVTPEAYVGSLMTICQERRGIQKELTAIDDTRVMLRYEMPLSEIVADFYDELKSISQGYASFDYEESGFQEADLVKLNVMLNGQPVDAMASIVHRSKALKVGRDLTARLKEIIPRQMFEVAIQAAIGVKVIARETISAFRKNVIAKCYGGDISRKRKLLEKQKEGKKRMRQVGSVEVPQEAFLSIMRKN